MRWLIPNPFETLSPLGLVGLGAAATAVGAPLLKTTARGLAMLTVRSALAIREAGEEFSRTWEEMAEEVKVRQAEKEHLRRAEEQHIREHGRYRMSRPDMKKSARNLALSTVKGAMAVRDTFEDIVDEAKGDGREHTEKINAGEQGVQPPDTPRDEDI